MAVLERSELEASPLADLHAIANQVGLDGFRRLRKAELIDAILGEERAAPSATGAAPAAMRTPARSARARASPPSAPAAGAAARPPRRRAMSAPTSPSRPARRAPASGSRRGRGRGSREQRRGRRAPSARGRSAREDARRGAAGAIAEGVVEVLGNGSAFLRVDPPEPSDDDVYISAAQVRRCELVSGDRVTGPVRTPRRSERYPSLVRIDTINGALRRHRRRRRRATTTCRSPGRASASRSAPRTRRSRRSSGSRRSAAARAR